MEKATVIEMVLFKIKEGINTEDAQREMTTLNSFVANQPGFISRKTGMSDDGQYLDIVLWKDLNAAKTASDKAMQDPNTMKIFVSSNRKQCSSSIFRFSMTFD
jgi:hypothetical protein